MKLLDTILIRGDQDKRIELYQGDLAAVSSNDSFDLLVVSAFPDDYLPTPTSLIGALSRRGLSVESLATAKDLDLRRDFSCWLSGQFTPPDPGISFRRILCFEPLVRGEPPEVVGDIFRALAPILGDKPEINTVAMPIVAAGDQGYSVAEMLRPLLDAAVQWLERGLPITRLKIVAHSDSAASEARDVFRTARGKYGRSSPTATRGVLEYDIFVSYARENLSEMEVLEAALSESGRDLRIFLDRKEIDIGTPWQPQIFESIDRCRKLVAMFSPDYLSSKVCKEEFNIAWVRSREADDDIIFPLYLYTADLPTYMKYRNYFDCREGDAQKIRAASRRLLTALDPGKGSA